MESPCLHERFRHLIRQARAKAEHDGPEQSNRVGIILQPEREAFLEIIVGVSGDLHHLVAAPGSQDGHVIDTCESKLIENSLPYEIRAVIELTGVARDGWQFDRALEFDFVAI